MRNTTKFQVPRFLAPEQRLSDFQPKFGYYSDRLAEYCTGVIPYASGEMPFTITASLMEDNQTYRIKFITASSIKIYDVQFIKHARNLLSLLKQGVLSVHAMHPDMLLNVKRVSEIDRQGLYPNSKVLYTNPLEDQAPDQSWWSRVVKRLKGVGKKEKFSG